MRPELGDHLAGLAQLFAALQAAGLFCGLLHCLLLRRRQGRPPFVGGDQCHRRVDMVGDGRVLLHLVHLVGIHVDHRVLIAVQRLDFQRRVDLGEGHRHGVHAHRIEAGQRHRALHHAHAQALHVRQRGQRALAVGHIAEGAARPDQTAHLHVGNAVQHLAADGAIEHMGGLGVAGKQKRKIKNLQRLLARGDGRERAHVQVLRAALHRNQHLVFAARGGAAVHIDQHLAIGRLGHIGGKLLHCDGAGVRIGKGMAQA